MTRSDDSFAEMAPTVVRLEQALGALRATVGDDTGHRVLARVASRIEGEHQDVDVRRVRRGRARERVPHARWYRAAAAALVMLVIAFVAVGVLQSPPRSALIYTTPVARQAIITLADGSRVILAPQSQLLVAKDFGHAQRFVSLRGEAYFEVQNVSYAPFVVQTGAITTRVIGTAFEIRQYNADTAVHVTVVRGKVAVSNHHRTTILTASMRASATDTAIATSSIDDPASVLGWTAGRLVFRDTPAGDVLTAVSHWYGVTFRLMDSTLAAKVLNAEIDSRRSRSDILAALSSVLDVQMIASGDTITVMPHRRPVAVPPVHQLSPLHSPSEVGR